jgi:hypothetical protein
MRLDDGFSTIISFADFPSVQFYEKEVTPPGMDGGGPNDTTTMRNITLRTMAPKKLKSMTQFQCTAAYDPGVYASVWSMINVNQAMTITFPEGDTLVFWGWVDKFEPGAVKEGEQPTATVTFQCSNQDSNGDEIAPVYTDA